MLEGAPDEYVLRAEALPQRNNDVDEWLAVWRDRRPHGAPPVVRLLVERVPPLCYPTLLPLYLQDPLVRVFSSWRALRNGVDGIEQWALLPHACGVNAGVLFDALGDGDAPIEVIVHVAHELADSISLLERQPYVVEMEDHGGETYATYRGGNRSSLLVRPFDIRHVHFAFDGDVSFDCVTDKIQLDRHAFEAQRNEVLREMTNWRAPAIDLVRNVLTKLMGSRRDADSDPVVDLVRSGAYDPALNHWNPHELVDRIGADPRIPAGRAELRNMMRSLFPTELARARDLEENARVVRSSR